VDEVEDLAQIASEPVEGVHDDGVSVAGIAEQGGQAGPVDGGAGLLVAVDACLRDAGRGEGVELPVKALPGGANPGLAEVESAGGMAITGSMTDRSGGQLRTWIPERTLWNDFRNESARVRPRS
jgi:hypothetical protein